MKPLNIVLAVSALYFMVKTMRNKTPFQKRIISSLPYSELIKSTENIYNLPNNILMRLLYQESHFREDIIKGDVLSAKGAQGIAQVMPLTAENPGFNTPTLIDPFDPNEAIPWAGAYLSGLFKYSKDWRKALAAYNAGMGTVNKAVDKDPVFWLSLMPLETQNYVNDITRDVRV